MAKSIQKLVDVTSFAKNEKGQMTFEYKNSSGQVKRTVLKLTFSDTYRGKKRTFRLPEPQHFYSRHLRYAFPRCC